MKAREGLEAATLRWKKLEALQAHYSSFIPFLQDGMEELGFSATEIQEEIGNWMEHGPQYLMVQAQRGQAKTTVAALFAIWCLMRTPSFRVLIISAGGQMANEISILIVRIIMNMDVLECMRPDKLAGDRTSTEEFDIHHSLKGLDKSPSIACIGIEGQLQGKRADLLLADDIESSKNSATATQRAKLLHLTKDFTSINSNGRIIWLGTPQTMESIYNSLPSRGVAIRIWPGRYPNEKQRGFYGANLAPSIMRKIAANPGLTTGGGYLGDQGQPVDPMILDEAALQKKEQDQGTPYFQLQHMLNTTLSDAMRFPLKPQLLTVIRGAGNRYPISVVRGMAEASIKDYQVCDFPFKLTIPHEISSETSTLQSIWAYVDPAAGGANGDETAYAIAGYLNGNIYLLAVGGVPGGYELLKLEALARKLCRFKLDGLTIEKNMGFGAFRQVFTPVLRKIQKEAGAPQCELVDDLVTGQKEMRIINTLSPIMGRGSLIVDETVIEEDAETLQSYAPALRQSYSFFYQIAKMNAVRNALLHDDRADAVEGVCRHFQDALAKDQQKGLKAAQEKAWKEITADPCGHKRYESPRGGSGNVSMLKRRR
jgi:hypothetical protein